MRLLQGHNNIRSSMGIEPATLRLLIWQLLRSLTIHAAQIHHPISAAAHLFNLL